MSLLLTSSVALMVLLAGWVDLVFAQSLNVTFMNNFLGVLDSMDLKNFTALVAQVTNGGDSSFATSLSDASSPKTLFVPNNNAFTQPGANFIGVDFLANDTQFLSSVLLYHLLDRKWTQNQLSTTSDTLLQTFLRGNNITFLENNSPQMIAGAQSSNGFQIVNQAQDTFVLQTFQYEHVTVQVINEIVGIPGPFTATIHTAGLTTLANLQAAAGYGTGLDTAIGLTVFAPFDDGFEAVREQIANTSATSLLNNHIIIGKTVRGSDFQFSQHTSQSLMNYTFNQDPMSEKFTVTLNGVTVNIVRTDFLVNNGVIHLVDGVLFNTTVPDLLAVPTPVSSTDISSPSSSSPNLASSMLSYAQPTMTNNATNGSSLSSLFSGVKLSSGPIVGIVVLTASILFCSITGFMVWRARRRAKMGWHIYRRPRWSSFDLSFGDREAQVIDPFMHEYPGNSAQLLKGAFDPPQYEGRPILSISTNGFQDAKSSPISPPDSVVVRGDGDRHNEVTSRHMSVRKGSSDIESGTARVPSRDPVILKTLMERFPETSMESLVSPPVLGDGRWSHEQSRPPTYYSMAQSARSLAKHGGLKPSGTV